LVIDTTNDTVTTVGAGGTFLNARILYYNFTLAPNGFLYAIPTNESRILKFNPNTNAISFIGDIGQNTSAYFGGCLGTNGKIYSGVAQGYKLMVFNTANDTFVQISLGGTVTYGTALANPNGFVYIFPATATSIIKVNTANNAISYITGIGSGTTQKYFHATYGLNGKIYAWNNSSVVNCIEFNPADDSYRAIGKFEDNAWNDFTLLSDGTIFTKHITDQRYRLLTKIPDPIWTYEGEAPTDLSTLPTSIWNYTYNHF
jgi:hypothetical protein